MALQPLQQLRLIGRSQLRGMGGRGRPDVRHEIGNGHVRLMTYGRDDGNLRIIDRPGHPLVIECPQILNGPAAPSGDDNVRHPVPVGVAQGSHDLRRGLYPLDPDGQQLHPGQRVPAAQDTDHVVDRRACGGGDDGDGLRVLRQGLLMGLVEEPLLPQLFLQLLEGHVKVPHPVGAQGIAVELIGPVPREDADPAHGQDLHAVLRPEPEAQGLSLEHDAPQGPLCVLQRKIVVPGGIQLIVGNFSPDADVPKLGDALQHGLHQIVQLRHAIDMPLHLLASC